MVRGQRAANQNALTHRNVRGRNWGGIGKVGRLGSDAKEGGLLIEYNETVRSVIGGDYKPARCNVHFSDSPDRSSVGT